MSIETLFPDNPNRAKRVNQLVSNIVDFQDAIAQQKKAVDEQSKHTKEAAEELMHQYGFKSFEDLQKDLLDQLSPDLRDHYKDLVDTWQTVIKDENYTLETFSIIASVGGLAGLSGKMMEFICTGKLIAGLDCIVRAISGLAKDVDASAELLRIGSTIIKSVSEVVEVGETAKKVFRVAKIVGKWVAAIGVFVDGILFIVSLIEGEKQRSELRDAIHDLVLRRFSGQTISFMSDHYGLYMGGIYSATTEILDSDPKDPYTKPRCQKQIERHCRNLQEDIKKNVTFETVRDTLKHKDSQESAWTDEDPSEDEVQKWFNEKEEPDIKYKGEQPTKHGKILDP